jgi:hypothetical protein
VENSRRDRRPEREREGKLRAASNKLRATSMSLFSLLSLDTIAWVCMGVDSNFKKEKS